MNIKKIIPILLLLTSFSFYAQTGGIKDKKDQIKALKAAFLTTELDLTTREAQKFWPIYNTYDDKQFEIRYQKMSALKTRMNDSALDEMSEKEAIAFLAEMESADEELFLLRKKLNKSLKEVIPAVKIIKLRKSEEGFNRKLLHQYRSSRK
ncbi:sensor of ECF-type sigma factor [Flavobacterium sp. Arc3]|uniref:sensor of ECF-type sigma factor n=1 Tax=unclassified Flavobacterium TaxID=196869 RepID=UPI00352E5DDE